MVKSLILEEGKQKLLGSVVYLNFGSGCIKFDFWKQGSLMSRICRSSGFEGFGIGQLLDDIRRLLCCFAGKRLIDTIGVFHKGCMTGFCRKVALLAKASHLLGTQLGLIG